jgi:MFS transporter, DHA2 family, methylenomycin A resistance protein
VVGRGRQPALSGGPVIGGVLIATLGWRSIFFINLPLGALGLGLTLIYARETPRHTEGRLDLAGAACAVTALTGFAWALIESGSESLGAPDVLGGFAVFAVGLILFVILEARSEHPMLPLGLFRRRRSPGRRWSACWSTSASTG